MTWILVGVGWALAVTFFLALCAAAADGDKAANLLLTRAEIHTEQYDELELGVMVALDESISPPAERRR